MAAYGELSMAAVAYCLPVSRADKQTSPSRRW